MRSLSHKAAETFLARLVAQVFALGGAIVIGRALGPAGKGFFSYAGTALALLQMANSGQSAAIAWQYTKLKRAPSTLLRTMLATLGAGTAIVACALIALAWSLPAQRPLLAVAAALPFALFVQSSTGFFLADGDVRTINVQQIIIGSAAVVVYAPLLIFAHAGLFTLLVIWVAAYALAALYTVPKLRRYAADREGVETSTPAKEQLHYGAQIGLNSVMQFLNFRIDVFIIMFMLGNTAVGIYSIGVGIGELLWQLSRPMATAAFSNIARGSSTEAADTAAACIRHSLALVAIFAVVVYFAAPPLVPLVYGKAFAGAGIVARLLLPGMIAYSVMPVLTTYFTQHLGRPRIMLAISAICTTACAIVTVLTIPRMGIAGGAIATSISYGIGFIVAAAFFVKETQIAPAILFRFTRRDLRPYKALLLHPFTGAGQ